MTPADIGEYLEHLNYYIFEGTEYRNDECAKARKLSALSNMYSFFNKRQMVYNNPLNAIERPKIHDKVITTLD